MRLVEINVVGLHSLLKLALSGLLLLVSLDGLAQVRKDSTESVKDTVRQLNEVTVLGNIPQSIKEAPGNLTVVDVKPVYNSGITPVQLLRGTVGVKVQQQAGYGSALNFYINGSTGKQLKFFLDGLPLDNLGQGFSVNNLPVEQIDRIEIYKGVIPVSLGADVLGGAVNIVTRKERNDYLDVSYSLGSFDTHRLNVAVNKRWSAHFYTALLAYGGYSKNNYGVDVANILDNGKLDTIHVNRFHDRYKNFVARAEAGFTQLSWADLVGLSLSRTGYNRQLQSDLTMTQPYAYANYGEALTNATLRYEKKNIGNRLALSNYLSYNVVHGLFIDTSRRVVLWDGSFAKVVENGVTEEYVRVSGAELGPAAFQHNYTRALTEKLTATYLLSPHSKLVFSNTLQRYRRTAQDTLTERLTGTDLYSSPSAQVKNVIGIGFDGAIKNERLKFSAAVKEFYMHSDGSAVKSGVVTTAAVTTNNVGYNGAASYRLSAANILKASYERAFRLPDAAESFGDLVLTRPNPGLQPEKSDNINLNYLHFGPKIDWELTGFYRHVSNLIYVVPDYSGHAQAKNLREARVTGVEAALTYRATRHFTSNANATYQNLRNESFVEGEDVTGGQYYLGQRIPNTPYFFANAGVSYKTDLGQFKTASLRAYYTVNYTHAYFLYWANDGDAKTKNVIPEQWLQNGGVTVSFGPTNVSLESYNLANVKAYDNFKAQLPGRSLVVKLRYVLTQNHN